MAVDWQTLQRYVDPATGRLRKRRVLTPPRDRCRQLRMESTAVEMVHWPTKLPKGDKQRYRKKYHRKNTNRVRIIFIKDRYTVVLAEKDIEKGKLRFVEQVHFSRTYKAKDYWDYAHIQLEAQGFF